MIDTVELKQQTDLLALAGQHTQLRPNSTNDLHGPCPLCGADGHGFHVKTDWFRCYKCNQSGDIIAYVRLRHNATFKQACEMLANGNLPTVDSAATPQPRPTQRAEPSPEWDQAKAERQLLGYQRALLSGGNPGADYLLGRGLDDLCMWHCFGLGYDARRNAIAMPWYRGENLCGIRFRLIRPTGDNKVISLKYSGFSGVLFGRQALTGCGERYRTLVLCEGEINALSIYQTCHDSNVDVLSLGSESSKLTDGMVTYAAKFRSVIVWMDKPQIRQRLQSSIRQAFGVHSETGSLAGRDANDMLRNGSLGGFLSAVRLQACADHGQRVALLWDLHDMACSWNGVDAGTAGILSKLYSDVTGKRLELIEVAPGEWRVDPVVDPLTALTSLDSVDALSF